MSATQDGTLTDTNAGFLTFCKNVDVYKPKVISILFSAAFFPTFSPFPSSLRFLIQQHLELLHTLQERVLKCQWQGIMGDIFMRLTSKEVNTELERKNKCDSLSFLM